MTDQHIAAFLDTYVRLDDGTVVLLCIHDSCTQFGAHLFALATVRGTQPTTLSFNDETSTVAAVAVAGAIDELRERPGSRRVVVVVCEPNGPTFVDVLESACCPPSKIAIFRITDVVNGAGELRGGSRGGIGDA